jgi:hypothetical protein
MVKFRESKLLFAMKLLRINFKRVKVNYVILKMHVINTSDAHLREIHRPSTDLSVNDFIPQAICGRALTFGKETQNHD